jgi:predicted amidophosphoribosyltransferase
MRPSRKGQIEGKRVLLIGGVRTTGTALNACTRALKQAGARHVDVLVPERVVRDSGVTI